MKLREQLLVEKCLNSIIYDYNERLQYHSALIDLKLDFLSFLTQNERECVEYGIKYLTENFINESEILMPLILEYNTYGTKGILEWGDIPTTTTQSCMAPINPMNEEEEKPTIIDNFVTFIKNVFGGKNEDIG